MPGKHRKITISLRQLWPDLRVKSVKLMEMNSKLFSRWLVKDRIMIDFKVPEFPERIVKKSLKNAKHDPS